jgi:hypothetical protein
MGVNIKIYLNELGWEKMDGIHLVQDRDKLLDFNMIMRLRVS